VIKMPFVDKNTRMQVRATLAFLFAISVIAGFFYDKISAEVFTPIALLSISWYYEKRREEMIIDRDVGEDKNAK